MTHNCRQINNYYIRVIIVAKIFSVSNKRFRIPISHFVNFWKKSFSTHYSRQINYHYSRAPIVAKFFSGPNKHPEKFLRDLANFQKSAHIGPTYRSHQRALLELFFKLKFDFLMLILKKLTATMYTQMPFMRVSNILANMVTVLTLSPSQSAWMKSIKSIPKVHACAY